MRKNSITHWLWWNILCKEVECFLSLGLDQRGHLFFNFFNQTRIRDASQTQVKNGCDNWQHTKCPTKYDRLLAKLANNIQSENLCVDITGYYKYVGNRGLNYHYTRCCLENHKVKLIINAK